MIRIAVLQNKGGVGKTTISKMLCEYFAVVKGWRVLGIDLDPQCNFTRRWIKMERDIAPPRNLIPPLHDDYEAGDAAWSGRSSSASIYLGDEVVPYSTYRDKIDILPGHETDLRRLESSGLAATASSDLINGLRNFLAMTDVQSSYDVVVIDTAPSKGPLTASAARAASHILLPTIMEMQPFEGLEGMLQLWREENRHREKGDDLKILGIVANQFQNLSIHHQLYQSLMDNEVTAPFVLESRIRSLKDFKETDYDLNVPRSVFEMPKSNRAHQDAVAFCELVDKRMTA